jgi:hypothetical protein
MSLSFLHSSLPLAIPVSATVSFPLLLPSIPLVVKDCFAGFSFLLFPLLFFCSLCSTFPETVSLPRPLALQLGVSTQE